jgi:hypothetical protein
MRWLVLVILLVLSGAAQAVPEGWQPVDQAVADLDRLSVSQRKVEVGLRYDGEQTSLFRAPTQVPYRPGFGPQSDEPYYRVGPGFIARVTRLDYIVRVGREGTAYNIKPRRDGEFLELVTANTRFELRPLEAIAPRVPLRQLPPARSPQLQGPMDLRLNFQVEPQRVESPRIVPR